MDIPNGILRYKTSKDAAELLGIQPQLVNRYCREGRLNAIKISGQWFIRPKDLKQVAKEEATATEGDAS